MLRHHGEEIQFVKSLSSYHYLMLVSQLQNFQFMVAKTQIIICLQQADDGFLANKKGLCFARPPNCSPSASEIVYLCAAAGVLAN